MSGSSCISSGKEVANFYGTKGNVSEDPAVIIKMMLLLFLDNVRQRARTDAHPPQNGSITCGFWANGLDDVIPNHSVLTQS
jgi:hypothetical protein